MPSARSTEVDSLGVINLIGSNLMDRYSARSILKELLQNADDAGAKAVVVGWTPGPNGKPSHELLQGPALFVVNDGTFTARDADAINRFGQNYKYGERSVIGKFGLGLKSVFHLCEAFFYLSSKPPDDDGLFNNLASPWAKTDFDRGWNVVRIEDLKLLHDFLRPICKPLGDNWFALWLPLRRNAYCMKARFGPRNDGDKPDCPPELLNGLSERGISRTLPLLHSVNTIRIWPGSNSPTADAEIRLASDAGRSLFRDYIKYVETTEHGNGKPKNFNDYYEKTRRCRVGHYVAVEAGVASTVTYALVQAWPAGLLDLNRKDDWPKSFVLSGGQQPDKAQPHAAVVLSHRPEQKECGLDVSLAVFLPLEGEEREGSKSPDSEFLLTLHGCFFIDSGRHAPYAGPGVRGEWNRKLMSEGALPILITAVDALAGADKFTSEMVHRLTEALSAWLKQLDSPDCSDPVKPLLIGKARDLVCRNYSWAQRWHPEGARWERLESTAAVLEIPDFGGDAARPILAMPQLADIAREFVLVRAGSPRLTLRDPEDWGDETLARAFDIADPQPLFVDGGLGLKYLRDFVCGYSRNNTAASGALVQTLRRIFASIRVAILEEHKDWLVEIVQHIPAALRRGLPLGGNWPDETRRGVCATGTRVLLLPAAFEPEANIGTAVIPTKDAIKALEILAGAMSPGRNTNPAAAIIRAAAFPAEVIEATSKLRLWTAQPLSGEKRDPAVYALKELLASHERHSAFVGPANEWGRELAAAVRHELTVIPQDTASVLFPSSGLPQGDLQGTLALLILAPQLSDAPARVLLLRRLLAQSPPGEILSNWRKAVRYLLHGNSALPVDDDLYLANDSRGVWDRLAETALGANGQADRIIPNNELVNLLNSPNRDSLGIKTLDQDGIAGLLGKLDLHSLRIRFSESERSAILGGLREFPVLIKNLPLHDSVGGDMTRITENSYWQGSGSPGTLARHIKMLRLCDDPVLAAIQKKTHSLELTPVELVRLALAHEPAQHAEVVLGVFASFRDLSREHREKLSGFQGRLEKAEWLPLQSGRRIAPVDVLHDEKLGNAILDALRIVRPVPGDPVPSAELSPEIRDHAGFREIAKQLFPSREQLVSRLGQVVKRDARFGIGNVDLRTQEELDGWLEAFRDAPVDVMAARRLINEVNSVDSDVCVKRLLPALRDGNLTRERLERILAFLSDRHDRGQGHGPVILQAHNSYLRQAAVDRAGFTSLLPKLRLLSESHKWENPGELCVASGIDPAHTLDAEHQELLKECVAHQNALEHFLSDSSDDPETADQIGDDHFADSVRLLEKYFQKWRSSEEMAGWAGAFLALLGDYEPLTKLAEEYLGIASPGRKVWYARTKAGMRDAQLITVSMRKPETPSELMRRQRVLFRFTDPSRPLDVLNLLGARITVTARSDFDNLLIGFGMDRVECSSLEKSGNLRVRCLHLRLIDPGKFPRNKLLELVRRTGELVLRVFFGQLESQIEFAEVLKEFSGDDAFGVRVAQESFLNGAQYALPYLGLRATLNKHLRELLKLADAAASRRAEENAMPDKHLPGESAGTLERAFREELQKQVSSNPEVQEELVAAVRRKVREFRYEPRSVLFEFFQNADDAYAECGSAADRNAAFLIRETDQGLALFHNGRPINRSPGGDDAGGYLHDLRKMLSLGHSDKGGGPTAGEVTGRFGLGFKSAFLITDRPRIVSGRLAFEVLGGVYPRSIESQVSDGLRRLVEAINLPRETGTMFQLQVRNDINLRDVVDPFHRLAHVLVVFGRRIRSIRCGAEGTSWDERTVITTNLARVVVGELRPLTDAQDAVRRAVVVRCGVHGDLLFGLEESGFVRFSETIPSIWVTAPTTENHDVGYLVNAPLDLDVGRCQVTWDSAANHDRLRDLGKAAGDALIALFDEGTECLTVSVAADAVWRSLWRVVSKPGKRQELHDQLLWGECGAARCLYSQRAALPTGLDALVYRDLTSLERVKYQLKGILDKLPAIFALVAKWNAFYENHPPGSVVSYSQVGRHLPKRLTTIDLATVLENEMQEANVRSKAAARLGEVFARDKLTQWTDAGEGEEVERIRVVLNRARFQTATGNWVEPGVLVTGAVGGDEAMRAAFAPDDCVLARDYSGLAVEFFKTCRRQFEAGVDVLIEWILGAGDDQRRRKTAVSYLGRGDLGEQIRRTLYANGRINGTWLEHLSKEEMQEAGLSEYEQGVVAAGLGKPSGTALPPPPPPPPPDIFERIADWWRPQAERRLREYNETVYPDGRLPNLRADGLGANLGGRIEWLKLFVTGIVQTIGRVTPDQNRTFIRLCETERWFSALADHRNGPRDWLAAVERYIDGHHADGIQYFHWLRHFVSVATVARHLDQYTQAFLAIDRFEGRFVPRDAMTTRTSRQFQFGGPDAPTLVPILGIGSCFVLRELVRMDVVKRVDVHPFCYTPVRRLRQFLERLGWSDDENASIHDRSRSIYEFVAEHLPDDPTFGKAFDIPLLIYAEEYPDF